MQTKTTRRRAQDRGKVVGGQDYEVIYETKKTGKTGKAVKQAIKSAGNSRSKVEKDLGGKKGK